MECIYLETCPFVKHCNENNAETSAQGFIHLYCKGNKLNDCVRKRLCEKFSREIVPKNMMPNGLPISGTAKEGWSEEAQNYRKLLS